MISTWSDFLREIRFYLLCRGWNSKVINGTIKFSPPGSCRFGYDPITALAKEKIGRSYGRVVNDFHAARKAVGIADILEASDQRIEAPHLLQLVEDRAEMLATFLRPFRIELERLCEK